MKLQTAKLRLTVNKLSGSNIPKATPAEEITELCGYSSNFALNQIPTATLSIPLGGKIHKTTLVQESSMRDWSNYLQNRVPVCVVMEVESEAGIAGLLTGLTVSNSKPAEKDEAEQGLIKAKTGKFCLFKGYVANINTSYGGKRGNLEVSLQHWLSDLALIPVLNPLSSPENPASLAMESCFSASFRPSENTTTAGINKEASWSLAAKAKDLFTNKKDIFDAIKYLFKAVAQSDYKMNQNAAGYINQALYDRVITALDAITGEELTLNPRFSSTATTVREAIGKELGSQVHDSYYSVTIWDKLITSLLPSFRMALVPMVDRAVVIPAPGIFMPDKEKPDVTPDHTTQLNVSLSKTGMLAGMSLVCSSTIAINGPCTAPAGHVTQYRYPITTKPGVFKVCQLPSWLMNFMDADGSGFAKKKAPNNVFSDPYHAFGRLRQNARKRLKNMWDNCTAFDRICQSFVKTVYFSEVTRQNSALLIANMDLRRVPGVVLKIQLPSSNPSSESIDYIQGVVTSVGHTITPNSIQAAYRLNHIRDYNLLNDPDLTTTEDVIFASGWKAVKASLAEVIK